MLAKASAARLYRKSPITLPTEDQANLSMAELFGRLPKEKRTEILSSMDPVAAEVLAWDWTFWGRPKQQTPPGDWLTWLLLAGRGFGKSRVGSEWIRQQVEPIGGIPKPKTRGAIVGATAAAIRQVIVEGDSGILNTAPPWFKPTYEPSLRQITWPNGAIASLYSAEEPERLRGPQHHWAFCDELCAWGKMEETWDQLSLGMRLIGPNGEKPRIVIATTPKPVRLLKKIMADPTTVVTRGTTFENLKNLAPSFQQQIMARYEGTRLGRQELEGELIEEVDGALWTRAMFEEARLGPDGKIITQPPPLRRVVVAIDPAVTAKANSDATGIIAAGLGADGRGYVLADASGKYSPDTWARKACALYESLSADRIVAEGNQGGDLVKHTIRSVNPNAAIQIVHASKGKQARAEPIAALYEQRKIGHCGVFGELEDECCTFEPLGNLPSPDRMDALVWALTALMVAPVRRKAQFGTYSASAGR